MSQGIGGVFREYDSSHVQNEDGVGEGASRERETHLNAEMEEERKIIYEQVGIDVPTAPHRILQNGLAGRKILNSGNDCDIVVDIVESRFRSDFGSTNHRRHPELKPPL